MLSTILKLRTAVAALALVFGSSAALADTTFAVSIDTTMFGNTGWIDFQYNPAIPGVSPATAVTLSGFQGFDPGAAVETTSQVSGSLASGYVIGNGETFNSLFHAVNYGQVLSFDVTFAGDNVDLSGGAYGSLFGVWAYDADVTATLGASSAADGRLLDITWAPATAPGGSGTFNAVSYSDAASISAVPEPSSWLMLGIGGLLVAGAAYRNRRTNAA
ncbi:NF038129 family PEP-CTERM protein [Pseudoduganella lutea]|uniref:PEP-CTERM sorting domain-containing protein n=1 Tax=Pseudoduganella lutea TaxID=321985 RepID=A0A4P6KUL0_9BURK|nr:NF038129 family PEP-CTERM protein [Pseudoduganella lutea]QBE62507.1 PEP-CTERM sorting domain-containing protein [Pseudoduganella lutea]